LYELYGFDFIIDEELNPWLMEISMNPSLTCDYEIEFKIKSMLIVDIVNIIGIIPYQHKKAIKQDNNENKEKPKPQIPKTLEQIRSNKLNDSTEDIIITTDNNKSKMIQFDIQKSIEKVNYKKMKENKNKERISSSNPNRNLSNHNKIEYKIYRKIRTKSNDFNQKESGLFDYYQNESYSTLNSTTISFASVKEINIKTKICKEFETYRNFHFDSRDYLANDYQEMIMDSEDQFNRIGFFDILFPKKENIEYYSKFIKDPKDDNIVFWKWIMSGSPYHYLKTKKLV